MKLTEWLSPRLSPWTFTGNLAQYCASREAAGVVTAVGPGLTGRQVGDLVAYAGDPMGSYAEEQILPANKVVPVPPSIDPIVAASVILKGMTAQFLLRRCFKDFVARVNEITSDNGVDVVYDAVGKDTFQGSLACLKPRGYMVNFGQSSGTPDPLPLSALSAKSLFLTRPSLMQYTATQDELLTTAGEVFANVESGGSTAKSLFLTRPSLMQYTATQDELLTTAGEVFANVESGILRVRVNHTYPLSQAAQAHADLESRKITGSVVLIP
ncbi:2-haloacrylate reductase [Quercus suber]|uniref:2-haloacrylate reductase n=1 Tax=Quercus suber TaxID=58331 RepID=A0AAW0L4T2_QUESU